MAEALLQAWGAPFTGMVMPRTHARAVFYITYRRNHLRFARMMMADNAEAAPLSAYDPRDDRSPSPF